MQVNLHWRTYYKTLEIRFYGLNSKMLTKSHTNEDHLLFKTPSESKSILFLI